MTNQLRILMITHKTKIASGPRSHAFAAQLVKEGHQVTLMLISENARFGYKEYFWDGIRVIETPDLLWGRLRTGWDPWNIVCRIFWLQREKIVYDLIHCFETRPATIYPALSISKKFHIPIITDWNDWWGHHGLIDVNRPGWYGPVAGWFETYYEEAFRVKSAGLTVIASGLEERAIALGVDHEKICYLPGGASTDQFKLMTREYCRTTSGLPLDVPILGFCSADSYLDIGMVIDSLALVAKKYPNVKLIMTGKVKQQVVDLAKKYQLDDRILFPGFLSEEEYPVYLGCSDVFLLPMADKPYNLGRWPNKMGDYLSLARPTVSNPVGDIRKLFEKYPVGLLAQWDPQDFANQIIYLLDHPDEAKVFGEKARWVAENIYNWSTLGEVLENFYQKTLQQPIS